MYAVIETGGKQYRVEVGTELEVELLEVSPGDAITLDRVLLVADGDTAAIGRPLVENASVAAQVVRQTRGEKVISFKYRPKARRRVKKGHRQELTILRISDIVLDGRTVDDGRADGGLVPVGDEEHPVQRDGLAGFDVEQLNLEHGADLDAVLLPAGLDDCVHGSSERAMRPRATATWTW